MEKQTIKSFKDLQIWNKAIDISVEIYLQTAKFPAFEMYGLTNQIRRASNSVSLNIAEGYGRKSTKSYIQYLRISQGSLCELESALLLGIRLSFIKQEDLIKSFQLIDEEIKMLHVIIEKLEAKLNKP